MLIGWSIKNEPSLWRSQFLHSLSHHEHAQCIFCMHTMITNCDSCNHSRWSALLSALTFKWEGAAAATNCMRTETNLMASLFERTKMQRARRKLKILRTRHHYQYWEPERETVAVTKKKEAALTQSSRGDWCVCLQAVRVWRAAPKIAPALRGRARRPRCWSLLLFLLVRDNCRLRDN